MGQRVSPVPDEVWDWLGAAAAPGRHHQSPRNEAEALRGKIPP